jgi:hypothetical protein
MSYVITDGHGYWVSQRRDTNGQRIGFWSTKLKDAARIHFPEVAQAIAKHLPMPVEIRRVRSPDTRESP